MSITTNTPASDRHFRYGNPASVCDGASMRAHCRQLATVVTIKGDLDGANIDRIAAYVFRFILPEKPLALALSGVSTITPQAISLFYDIDEWCGALGVDWAVVAGPSVVTGLRLRDEGVPLIASVPEALHHFAEGTLARRRLLPLLTKTA